MDCAKQCQVYPKRNQITSDKKIESEEQLAQANQEGNWSHTSRQRIITRNGNRDGQ